MIVKVPTSLDDITIEQFQKYNRIMTVITTEEAKTIGVISIFCNLTTDEVISMDIKDVKEISNKIVEVLNQPTTFIQKFDKYGFIPNLDKMTAGEYIDLDKYLGDIENAHRAMTIMYRKIKNKFLDTYEIEPYSNTDKADEMLKAPLSVYLGAMVFFWNLSKDLLKCMRQRLENPNPTVEGLEKVLQSDGVGISHLIQSLQVAESNLTELLSYKFTTSLMTWNIE